MQRTVFSGLHKICKDVSPDLDKPWRQYKTRTITSRVIIRPCIHFLYPLSGNDTFISVAFTSYKTFTLSSHKQIKVFATKIILSYNHARQAESRGIAPTMESRVRYGTHWTAWCLTHSTGAALCCALLTIRTDGRYNERNQYFSSKLNTPEYYFFDNLQLIVFLYYTQVNSVEDANKTHAGKV